MSHLKMPRVGPQIHTSSNLFGASILITSLRLPATLPCTYFGMQRCLPIAMLLLFSFVRMNDFNDQASPIIALIVTITNQNWRAQKAEGPMCLSKPGRNSRGYRNNTVRRLTHLGSPRFSESSPKATDTFHAPDPSSRARPRAARDTRCMARFWGSLIACSSASVASAPELDQALPRAIWAVRFQIPCWFNCDHLVWTNVCRLLRIIRIDSRRQPE